MASNSSTLGGAKKGYSEAEKYSFLLQIVHQLGGEKPKIKWDQIQLPGRTPKALTHLWAKIKLEIEEGGFKMTADGKSNKVTATPADPSRKQLKKKSEDTGDGESAAKKRKVAKNGKTKVEKEEEVEEEEEGEEEGEGENDEDEDEV